MEVLTNETNEATQETPDNANDEEGSIASKETMLPMMTANMPLSIVPEEIFPSEVGVTKESLLRADEAKRSRTISRMTGKFTAVFSLFVSLYLPATYSSAI
jgi:hypothetical protein